MRTKQKYISNDIVYSWYFDLHTSELTCRELTVFRWDYMDGMQWKVVDEYQLVHEYKVPWMKFLTKTKKEFIRRPGYLISNDRTYAKLLVVDEMVKSFGYLLEKDYKGYDCASEATYKASSKAKEELSELSEKYPELVVKLFGEFRPDETNSGWLWSSYGNV